jgi:hypothetical protein
MFFVAGIREAAAGLGCFPPNRGGKRRDKEQSHFLPSEPFFGSKQVCGFD